MGGCSFSKESPVDDRKSRSSILMINSPLQPPPPSTPPASPQAPLPQILSSTHFEHPRDNPTIYPRQPSTINTTRNSSIHSETTSQTPTQPRTSLDASVRSPTTLPAISLTLVTTSSGSVPTLVGSFISSGSLERENTPKFFNVQNSNVLLDVGHDDNAEDSKTFSVVQQLSSGGILDSPYDISASEAIVPPAPEEATNFPLFEIVRLESPNQQGDTLNGSHYEGSGTHVEITNEPVSSLAAMSTHELVRGTDVDGNKLLNEYVVVAPLGQGTFGKVKLVVDSNKGRSVAIKILNKSRLEKQSRLVGDAGISPLQLVHQEIAIMKACRHPNLVKLINVIKDPSAPKLYLVMEYMEGGVLAKTPSLAESSNSTFPLEPKMEIRLVRKHLLDIVHGLHFLHNRGVIHMDIKPENILLGKDGSECKLADFGVCVVLSRSFAINHDREDTVYNIQGTPLYFAPEMVDPNRTSFHGRATDVWALGVTIYVLVYGRLPFRGVDLREYHEAVRTQEPMYSSLGGTVPLTLIDLIRRMLCKNPERRLSVSDVVYHPFLVSAKRQDLIPLRWWIRCWKENKARDLTV